MHRRIAAAVAAAALGWVAALIAAPLLTPPIAGLLYAAGALICHQIPERSFHVAAFQLPVCARCLGLYAGGAMGSVAAAVVVALPGGLGDRGVRGAAAMLRMPDRRIILTVVSAIPTIVTGVLEHGLGVPVSNVVRAVAALPLAAVVAFVVVSAMTHPPAAGLSR